MYGNHLDHGCPDAEQQGVAVGARDEAGAPEHPHADPGAEADHRRQDQLTPHVAGERLLDPVRQRQAVPGRKAAVDEPLEPLHVEQHVDRDHDDEDDVEERHDDRRRGSLGERDGVLRVGRDLARAEVVDPVRRLLLDLDALEAVRVEPVLEPVDVLLGPRLPAGVRDGHVLVDAVGRGAGLVDDDAPEGERDEGDGGGEEEEDEEDGDPTRQPHPLEVAHERVQQERDHSRDEEEEDDMAEEPRQHPHDEEQHGQADELNPARHPDRRP